MNRAIETYKDLMVQIATPYNMGTGFYLSEYDVIVTNEHVVRDNCDVVISGTKFKKQIVRVLYLDMKYDLAFISPPVLENQKLPKARLSLGVDYSIGDTVLAVAHPFSKQFKVVQGSILKIDEKRDGIEYIDHSVSLNPGNSGGPLLNEKGEIIGVNTFIVKDGANIGFSLLVSELIKILREFKNKEKGTATRCYACLYMIFEKEIKSKKYCPECGGIIQLPSEIEPYEPKGCAYTIENLLIEMGHDVKLTRRGPNNWGIQQGSARINISYYEKTGLIIGDASLCKLPVKNSQPLYKFLLHQNYKVEGLTFSVQGNYVVLSLLIYDRYLNAETGRKLFRYLFEKADYYDDILVEKYGASWNYEKNIE